jgi:hypothetical protein
MTRFENLTLGARLKLGRGLSQGDGLKLMSSTWRACAPVTGWLDEHLGPSEA